ncbi:PREDICTED: protein-lysine N-methyltransferase mettl10 [Rhagoletis zephyria]|uniref:protein-lysine N-methyltransferase mettl10 n=1 Tax=Rhagoletis zephyria TaxID=28612 RepID=UPI000811857D|nr:PREDICTED: protein-lysine N-methyltransferase mettl10 [Rhagoletis zephyria]XP_017486396.1 PREDICTED: protein-lysine N-methyltransferase mettl10 [Rhagoletis zephyria]
MSVDELNGSELGTKEYWDNSYDREIKNYKNYGDVGEIWFDEDSQIRVINWIMKQDNLSTDIKIIDMGCGNGMLLIELAREGYTDLLGVDYSPNAIELAKQIAKDQELIIRYEVADLLNNELFLQQIDTPFGIVHDKGTYDAISLCPKNPKEKREAYIRTVHSVMDEKSVFIITSCNWTEDELIISFVDKFLKKCTIPTPSFKFGGKVGSVVSSIVFTKKIS